MDHGKRPTEVTPEDILRMRQGLRRQGVIFHAAALHLPVGAGRSFGIARDACSAASAGSSSDSSNSYNGDDARHFIRERNKVRDLYSDATHEIGLLEFCLNASQTALTAAEGETSAVRLRLAEADARVADLVAQLEALQLVANGASAIVNARGTLLEDHLRDILTHAREVSLNGVRHGGAFALAAAQVRSGHKLRHREPDFPAADVPEDLEDLVEDAKAIAMLSRLRPL